MIDDFYEHQEKTEEHQAPQKGNLTKKQIADLLKRREELIAQGVNVL